MESAKSQMVSKPKRYEELTFTDDFMFCKIMQSNEKICKELLELILDKKIKLITYPEQQKTIEITSDGKGIRLDIYVEDDVSEDLKQFLRYLVERKAETEFTKKIEEAVKNAGQHEKWRGEYMTLLMRDQENREIGIEIGMETEVFNSVFEEDYSVERGAEKLNLTKDQFKEKYRNWLEEREKREDKNK